jgi:TolB-like protein
MDPLPALSALGAGSGPEAAEKLKVLSVGGPGGETKDESGIQGAVDIARAIAEAAGKIPKERSPLLAIPFSAGPGDTPQAKLADSAFTLLCGRLAISHQGKLGVSNEPMASLDPRGAAERGRARHSAFVLCGGVGGDAGAPVLTVDIVRVADGSVAWTKTYPAADADPAAIAADVESHVPSLEDD